MNEIDVSSQGVETSPEGYGKEKNMGIDFDYWKKVVKENTHTSKEFFLEGFCDDDELLIPLRDIENILDSMEREIKKTKPSKDGLVNAADSERECGTTFLVHEKGVVLKNEDSGKSDILKDIAAIFKDDKEHWLKFIINPFEFSIYIAYDPENVGDDATVIPIKYYTLEELSYIDDSEYRKLYNCDEYGIDYSEIILINQVMEYIDDHKKEINSICEEMDVRKSDS